MEEVSQGQYRVPIQRSDGVRVSMEVKQKHLHSKQRKVKTWTQQQDAILLNLYSEHPKKWAIIASLMHDRNENQCLHRYRRITQEGDHRKIWSNEEDETIKKLMRKVGKNWKVLSQMLGTKTGKQIRERFINKLDPKIKKDEWDDEEDRKIIILYAQLGRKWSEISKHLPGRPQNKVKNRFYSYIQKNYDIKYRPVQEKYKENDQQGQQRPLESQLHQKNGMSLFKQVSNVCKPISGQGLRCEHKPIYHLPSINRFDEEIKIQDFCENQYNVFNGGLISMNKVEQQWKSEMKDQFDQEFNNEFFFLSNNS